MMRPERWFRSAGSAARVTLIPPHSLVLICARKSSSVKSSIELTFAYPALLPGKRQPARDQARASSSLLVREWDAWTPTRNSS